MLQIQELRNKLLGVNEKAKAQQQCNSILYRFPFVLIFPFTHEIIVLISVNEAAALANPNPEQGGFYKDLYEKCKETQSGTSFNPYLKYHVMWLSRRTEIGT